MLPKYIEILKNDFTVYDIYLNASDQFVDLNYLKRVYAQEMLKSYSGEIALKNLLERDRLYYKYIMDQANIFKSKIINIKDESDFVQLHEVAMSLLNIDKK